VVAAGKGRRAGLSVNKVFCRYKGFTILDRSLDALSAIPEVDGIVLVLSREDRKLETALRRRFPKILAVAEGGRERPDSVKSGLELLTGFSQHRNDVVLIHDAARPFLSRHTVKELLRTVGPNRGSVPGFGAPNTLKRVVGNRVVETLDRSGVVEIQTPQAFRLKEILMKYSGHGTFVRRLPTDDAEIFERSGGRVVVVSGSGFLFKITWPEDIELYRILVDADVQNRLRG
jgi:2-C-methyl-D-erythritol 4-phosphate cytidylyltransferase